MLKKQRSSRKWVPWAHPLILQAVSGSLVNQPLLPKIRLFDLLCFTLCSWSFVYTVNSNEHSERPQERMISTQNFHSASNRGWHWSIGLSVNDPIHKCDSEHRYHAYYIQSIHVRWNIMSNCKYCIQVLHWIIIKYQYSLPVWKHR